MNKMDPSGLGLRGAVVGGAFGAVVGVVLGTVETALTVGTGYILIPEIVAGGIVMGAFAGHLVEELGYAIGTALDDSLMWAEGRKSCPPVPVRDATGKLHGELPDYVPDSWTQDDINDAINEL